MFLWVENPRGFNKKKKKKHEGTDIYLIEVCRQFQKPIEFKEVEVKKGCNKAQIF